MLRFILFCVVAFSGYYLWAFFPVSHGPGITAPEAPEISRITWEKPFPFKEYSVVPLKRIESTVRVLEHKRYFFDTKSEYSPMDILVGWDDLSDERNLNHLHFELSNRVSDVKYSRPPLPIHEIYGQTALWHLVPSTEEIERSIKQLREGNIITLGGFIVDIESDTKYGWKSDLQISSKVQHMNTIVWITELKVR